jgi:hypothetical protein
MVKDEIVEEVRTARAGHAAKHDNDLRRIVADLKDKQDASNRPVASFPPRRPMALASPPGDRDTTTDSKTSAA